MAKLNEIENNSINLIGVGTIITGNIESNGDIRIDGTLKGNLNTKGKIVIGSTGIVVGEIICKNSDISGKVEGKLVVNELLSLKSTAKIFGDVITDKLAIEPGAVFTGTCNMSKASHSINGESKEAKRPEFEKAPVK